MLIDGLRGGPVLVVLLGLVAVVLPLVVGVNHRQELLYLLGIVEPNLIVKDEAIVEWPESDVPSLFVLSEATSNKVGFESTPNHLLNLVGSGLEVSRMRPRLDFPAVPELIPCDEVPRADFLNLPLVPIGGS